MNKEKWGKQGGRKGREKAETTESDALSNLLIDIILSFI